MCLYDFKKSIVESLIVFALQIFDNHRIKRIKRINQQHQK